MRLRKGGYEKFMERCTGIKQPATLKSPVIMGKPIEEAPDLSRLKDIGIPPSIVTKLKEVQKKADIGATIKASEHALVNDVNEAIAPIVGQSDPSVNEGKKKPPYLLIGAIGVIALVVAIKVLK